MDHGAHSMPNFHEHVRNHRGVHQRHGGRAIERADEAFRVCHSEPQGVINKQGPHQVGQEALGHFKLNDTFKTDRIKLWMFLIRESKAFILWTQVIEPISREQKGYRQFNVAPHGDLGRKLQNWLGHLSR